jgi:hypothetical protein
MKPRGGVRAAQDLRRHFFSSRATKKAGSRD